MTEEQLKMITDEAELEAAFLYSFENGVSVKAMSRIAFVHGARFGFRLASQERLKENNEYVAGGRIDDL